MIKKTALTLILLFTASLAFAHAGHQHVHMGTITTMHKDGSFMLLNQKDETWHVVVSDKTVFLNADGTPAKRTDLAVNKRVVVKLDEAGTTALSVKIGK